MIINHVIKNDIRQFIDNFIFTDEVSNCTFLMTGATGLIGSTIIRCLLALNDCKNANLKIIGLVRSIEKAKSIINDSRIQWISCDLSNPVVLTLTDVDYIFHCACPTSSKFYVENPVELIKTSVNGTMSVLDYAKNNNIKGMVYLSSCEVYGAVNDDSCELEEDYSGYINPIDVRSGYPVAKRLLETLCHSYYKEYSVPITIARLTQTFGAGVSLSDNRVFAQFVKSAIRDKDIVLHTKGHSSKPYCYTIDAINAMFYMMIKGKQGEAYNVANETSYISIIDLANYLAKEFSNGSRVVISEKSNMGYAPDTKLRMSTKKIQSLGWSPLYSMDQMFSSLAEYYKTQINER